MADIEILRRFAALLALVALWVVLSLVLGSFALMTVDLGVGLLALVTVVLVTLVGARSYFGVTFVFGA